MRRLTVGAELCVSHIGLGLGGFGTRVRGAEAEEVLSGYLAAGGNFLDTAHCYACWAPEGAGCSERELGRCLQRLGLRSQVLIATKGGHPTFGESYLRPDAFLSPERIEADALESLERMGVDQIDLYYLHRDDPRVPVDEIHDALESLVLAGMVRETGSSNWSLERLTAYEACARKDGGRGFAINQYQWSLAVPRWQPGSDPTTRYVTSELAAFHREQRLPIAAYTPTAQGFFAGRSHADGNFGTELNQRLRDRVSALATELTATPTQIALAWLIQQSPVAVPLLGTGDIAHLMEGLGAADILLPDTVVQELNSLRSPAAFGEPTE